MPAKKQSTKKTAAKKAVKKATAKKTVTKKTVAKKASAPKKPVAKKAPAKKATAKKAPAKKAPAKKAAAKQPAAKKAPAKKKAAKKAVAPAPKPKPGIKAKMTKTAILNEIAESTNLSRAQVGSVLEELESLIERHIRKRAAGEFTLPGLLKIKAAKRPATKKRMGRNPATGEQIHIAAKKVVKFRVSKACKDAILNG